VIAQPGGDGDWRITCGAATQTKVFPIFQSRTHTHPYNYIIAECQAGRKCWILMDIHRWSIYSTPGQAPLHLSPGNPPQSPTKIYLITPQGSHSHSLGQPPRYNRNYSRHAATLFRELRVGGFVTRQFIGKALEFQTELAAKAKLRRFMQSAPFPLKNTNFLCHDRSGESGAWRKSAESAKSADGGIFIIYQKKYGPLKTYGIVSWLT